MLIQINASTLYNCITDFKDPWATGASQLTKGPKMDAPQILVHKAAKNAGVTWGNWVITSFPIVSSIIQPQKTSFHSYWSRVPKSQVTKLDIQGTNLSTGCLEFRPGASIRTVHIQDRPPSFQVALVNLKVKNGKHPKVEKLWDEVERLLFNAWLMRPVACDVNVCPIMTICDARKAETTASSRSMNFCDLHLCQIAFDGPCFRFFKNIAGTRARDASLHLPLLPHWVWP